MVTGNENVQFDLNELLCDIIATQLAQEAKIIGIKFFVQLLAKRLLIDEPAIYDEFLERLEAKVKKEGKRLLDESIVMQQIIKNKTKEELGVIPGINWD